MTIQAIQMNWWVVTEFLLKGGVSPDVCEVGGKRRFAVHILAAEHQPQLYELAIRMMPDPPPWARGSECDGELAVVHMARGKCDALYYSLCFDKRKIKVYSAVIETVRAVLKSGKITIGTSDLGKKQFDNLIGIIKVANSMGYTDLLQVEESKCIVYKWVESLRLVELVRDKSRDVPIIILEAALLRGDQKTALRVMLEKYTSQTQQFTILSFLRFINHVDFPMILLKIATYCERNVWKQFPPDLRDQVSKLVDRASDPQLHLFFTGDPEKQNQLSTLFNLPRIRQAGKDIQEIIASIIDSGCDSDRMRGFNFTIPYVPPYPGIRVWDLKGPGESINQVSLTSFEVWKDGEWEGPESLELTLLQLSGLYSKKVTLQ